MKRFLISASVLFLGGSWASDAFAQDVIHTLDSRPIEAKVIEITDDYIRYKTFDNLEGPDYRMSVSRIARIVFENGTEKVFAPATVIVPGPYSYDYYGPYGPLEYRWGHYYDRRGRVYAEQLRDYMGVSLYGSEYLKAQSQYQWGMWLTLGGATLLVSSIVGGAMLSDYNNSTADINSHMSQYGMGGNSSSGEEAIYIAGGIAGAACIGVGIPLWVKGNRRLNRIADDYNQRYGGRGYGSKASLNLGATGSGFGLALSF